ncbi:MAG: sigma-70 family RNA polymerase sigma factor [Opitutus sp.]|nr:sigma-70 family RNA polymerase sigma factor [Opitutus sp.]
MSISLSCFPDGLVCTVTDTAGTARLRQRPGMTPPDSSHLQSPDERQITDGCLMRQVAKGDRTAFARLYDRFSGPLHGAALRILRDPAEAQDVVHDAFVAIWEKAATFEASRGSAFSWTVTLVRNRAIDRVRMRNRRAELLAESAPGDLGYGEEAAAPTSGEIAALGDDARAVRAAVATLPPEQKRALELAFFGGFTQEEIARKLSEPLGTVKARIRRGLLKLRDSLAPRP